MRDRIDVIEVLRRVNPVPPSTSTIVDEAPEDVLGSLRESETEMSNVITVPEAVTRPRKPVAKFFGAAAILVAVVVVGVMFTPSQATVADWGDVPSGQQEAITQVVEAMGERDADAFVSAFGSDGTFGGLVRFESGPTGRVSEPSLVEAWLAIFEVWDLEIEVPACRLERATSVICTMDAKWNNLRMQTEHELLFVFDGAELRSAGIVLGDVDVDDPELPLTYRDLAGWEEWLKTNVPDEAERLLGKDGPTGRTLSIGGVEYESAMLRYDPGLAERIRASIDEYIATR